MERKDLKRNHLKEKIQKVKKTIIDIQVRTKTNHKTSENQKIQIEKILEKIKWKIDHITRKKDLDLLTK